MIQLSERLEADWPTLSAHYATSTLSHSTPDLSANIGGRSVGRKLSMSGLPFERAKCRATNRYSVVTDISTCYPSIYTHSIPWALGGKSAAKVNQTNPNFHGNEIDRLVRNGQDRQTIGIPIGPDTSFLVAEAVLTSADKQLATSLGKSSFRYVDDYECCFRTLAEAEAALGDIENVLNQYELQLNPRKTEIRELPIPIEPTWVSELRVFQIRASGSNQQFDLTEYFARAITLAKEYPSDPVLKYSVARLNWIPIDSDNWALLQSLLLQVATTEPGCLSTVLERFVKSAAAGLTIDIDMVGEMLSVVILTHARLGHGSEVAWALFFAMVIETKLSESATREVCKIDDSIVALLALDANTRGVMHSAFSTSIWSPYITADDLRAEHWLLAYEAFVKHWLPSIGGDHIRRRQEFKFLRDRNISFYNKDAVSDYKTRVAAAVELSEYGASF